MDQKPHAQLRDALLELIARAAYEAIQRGDYRGPATLPEKGERVPDVPTKRPAA